MENKFDLPIQNEEYVKYLETIKNSIYRTFCLFEEEKDWKQSLDTVILELNGIYEVFNRKEIFLRIITKLESLNLIEEFQVFRKVIFEILTLFDQEVKQCHG